MELQIDIGIPVIWGEDRFTKTDWAPISYLVGPNGSGKTLFAEQLKAALLAVGLRPRYLSADRLYGLERGSYSSYGYSNLTRGLDLTQFGAYQDQGPNGDWMQTRSSH